MKNPGMEPQTRLVKAEILIGKRNFDEAKALLNTLPPGDVNAQAIELALAGAYYSMGRVDEARTIYTRFFDHYKGRVPSDPGLLKFYQEAAYTFGQMLEASQDYKGAADAYQRVLSTQPDKETQRRLQAECAKLYLMSAEALQGGARSKVLDQAETLCNELQWGGIDIWFGQSISTLAHVELMRGNPEQAKNTIKEYMDILKQIDTFLKESGLPLSESPMAEARFMLGELYENDANQAASRNDDGNALKMLGQALNEYYNVFIQYGDSDFGPKAGLKSEGIIARLEKEYGKKVQIDLGKNKGRASEQAFRMADNLYRNGKYREALEEYEQMIARYPTGDNVVPALVNMVQCYAHTGDPLMAKVTMNYLGECFGNNEQAPYGLLAVGKIYFDANDKAMYIYAYDRYLDYFPQHEKAGAILYTLAGYFRQEGDDERSTSYYRRLAAEHPNDRYSIKALSNLAWTEYNNKNYKQAVNGFKGYLKTVQPGYEKAKAQFCLADSYLKLDQFIPSLKAYNRLVSWLAPKKNNPYDTSAEAAEKNRELYEKAQFYRAYVCSLIKKPAKLVKPLRKKGIGYFKAFVKEFPQSDLAPKAMARMGGMQLELNQFDAAVKTFDELASRYPNAPEGENALFSLVRSAMEVEKFDVARDALNKMLTNPTAYQPKDFARIGQLMVDAELYPEAIQALNHVTGATEERGLLERALYGKGTANYALKNYAEAIAQFEELMERYPKSGLFYDAKFVLGNAYYETKQAPQAIAALSDVFKYADDPVLINRANYILGRVQVDQDDPEAALASFQRVALLADADNPELRPIIQQCILASLPLGMQLERYQDVQDSCDQYEELFPTSNKLSTVRKIKTKAKRQAAMTE